MKAEFSGRSDIGLSRKLNQDAILMRQAEGMYLFAVADGMGGHKNGEIASRLIVERLGRWGDQTRASIGAAGFPQKVLSLRQELEAAHEQIYREYSRREICGSTCTVLLLEENRYAFMQVGDSRLYRLKGRRAELLTRDDVWENQREVIETLREKEIRNHYNKGRLVQAVGAQETIQVAVATNVLVKNTVFLLCSDGIYKMCGGRNLGRALRMADKQDNIEEALDWIMKKVYENGAGDNASAIVCKVRLEGRSGKK